MNMPEPFIADIVARQSPFSIRGAEALLRTVAGVDYPGGIAAMPCRGGRVHGFAVGTGKAFAQAHGLATGAVAIAVAVDDILHDSLQRCGGDIASALTRAVDRVEYVAAHELAHLIAEDADEVTADEGYLRSLPMTVGDSPRAPSAHAAAGHGPRWAGALVILARRVMRFRPASRFAWQQALERDLRSHGIEAQAITEAVDGVADGVGLRGLLAEGGGAAIRLSAAVPSIAERVAIIDAMSCTTPDDPAHVAPVVSVSICKVSP